MANLNINSDQHFFVIAVVVVVVVGWSLTNGQLMSQLVRQSVGS